MNSRETFASLARAARRAEKEMLCIPDTAYRRGDGAVAFAMGKLAEAAELLAERGADHRLGVPDGYRVDAPDEYRNGDRFIITSDFRVIPLPRDAEMIIECPLAVHRLPLQKPGKQGT